MRVEYVITKYVPRITNKIKTWRLKTLQRNEQGQLLYFSEFTNKISILSVRGKARAQ